jgi:hypothetical protein
VVLGVLGRGGRTGYLTHRVVVTEAALERIQAEGDPTALRFAAPCAGAGCVHWDDHRCGLVEDFSRRELPDRRASLPRCSIRSQCRWFAQRGADGCAACEWVMRDPLRAEPAPAG